MQLGVPEKRARCPPVVCGRRRRISDCIAKLFVGILALSATSFWKQYQTLTSEDEREQIRIDTPIRGNGEIPAARRGRRSSSNLGVDLRNETNRTNYFTCRILNESATLPTIPHFLIVGAQKSGTTALMEFLKEHPDIQSTEETETHFFDWHYPSSISKRREWLSERNLPLDLPAQDMQCAIQRAYLEYFNMTTFKDTTVFFEKTPGYLFLKEVPERIAAALFWKPKVVVILRNPVDRAFSNYRMKIQTHGRTFEDIVDEEIQNLKELGLSRAPLRNESSMWNDQRFRIPNLAHEVEDEFHKQHYRKIHHCNYIQKGMYSYQLRHWLRLFPIDKVNPSNSRLLVLNYEEFKEHPELVFSRLLDFVGVSPFVPEDNFMTLHNYHPRRTEQIRPETHEYLTAFFRPYNARLAHLLGEDQWKRVWSETS